MCWETMVLHKIIAAITEKTVEAAYHRNRRNGLPHTKTYILPVYEDKNKLRVGVVEVGCCYIMSESAELVRITEGCGGQPARPNY